MCPSYHLIFYPIYVIDLQIIIFSLLHIEFTLMLYL
jgi:hypothetical protein